MVYVRLEGDWTDGEGNRHAAGDTVDVDAATLAKLQARGLAADPAENTAPESWAGPTGDAGTESWAGPTGDAGTESWAGPTGDDGDS
jgi:hypothetical protein